MARPIMNLSDVTFNELTHGERFQARTGMIGAKIGAQKLGYSVTVVPPGKRACPFHNHRANEEMFFVLEGEGEVRIGPETYPIRTGDVIACPSGGQEVAHQIVNTSHAELRYLAVSTKISPEICEYPDSGKFGVLAVYPAQGDARPEQFRFVDRPDGGLDYWEGE